MSPTLVTLYIVFCITATGYGVGWAAHADALVRAAIPLSGVLIVALRPLGARSEQIGWAAFTGWLGMTYAHTGGPVEVVAFFVYVALAAWGLFRWPWWLGIAWAAHVAWDFVPRDLPKGYESLPVACMLFDGPIAAYMLHCAWSGRWKVLVGSKETGVGAR
jgi:hypothetical protein